jgi:hypothetical protein
MSEEQNAPEPPPNDGNKSVPKIIWLFAAFIPSVIGIGCLHVKYQGRGLLSFLLLLNLIFSVASSVGLVRGMKPSAIRAIMAIFFIIFFFVLNVFIVSFVGCSGGGRIAP